MTDDRTVTDLETIALEELTRFSIKGRVSRAVQEAVAAVRELARRAEAAEADRDRLQAALEKRPGVEILPGGTEIDWKGDATYAVEQMQAWRERAVAAEADRDRLQGRERDLEAYYEEHTAAIETLRKEAQTLRDALEQIAAMHIIDDRRPPAWAVAARAALDRHTKANT